VAKDGAVEAKRHQKQYTTAYCLSETFSSSLRSSHIPPSYITNNLLPIAALVEAEPDRAKEMMEAARARAGTDHPDAGLVEPCPVPLVFVLNKYDTMKDLEPASRKCLLQALRFVSHANGGMLVCGSNRDKPSRDMYKSAARQQLFHKQTKATLVEQQTDGQQNNEKSQPWKWAEKYGDGPVYVKVRLQ